MNLISGKLQRRFAIVLYYMLAQHLPESRLPFGGPSRRIRVWCASRFCDHVAPSANIERHAYLGQGCGISIGDRSGVGVRCRLHGPVELASGVLMGPDVVLIAQMHQIGPDGTWATGGYQVGKISVGPNVWIGTRVTILSGVSIGAGSVIGAGAVVPKSVPCNSVVVGAAPRLLEKHHA